MMTAQMENNKATRNQRQVFATNATEGNSLCYQLTDLPKLQNWIEKGTEDMNSWQKTNNF